MEQYDVSASFLSDGADYRNQCAAVGRSASFEAEFEMVIRSLHTDDGDELGPVGL